MLFFSRLSEKASLVKMTFEQRYEKSRVEAMREKHFRQLE